MSRQRQMQVPGPVIQAIAELRSIGLEQSQAATVAIERLSTRVELEKAELRSTGWERAPKQRRKFRLSTHSQQQLANLARKFDMDEAEVLSVALVQYRAHYLA